MRLKMRPDIQTQSDKCVGYSFVHLFKPKQFNSVGYIAVFVRTMPKLGPIMLDPQLKCHNTFFITKRYHKRCFKFVDL